MNTESIWKTSKSNISEGDDKCNKYEFCDFRNIRDLYLESHKDKSVNDFVKICFTNHAWNRINNERNRYCPVEAIDDIFSYFAYKLIKFPYEEEFSLIDTKYNVAIHGCKTKINNITSFVLYTVVRNFGIREDGTEYTRKLRVNIRNKRI